MEDQARLHRGGAIRAACFRECVAHDAAGAPRRQRAGAPFEINRFHAGESDLWISLRSLADGEFVDDESELLHHRQGRAHIRVVAAMHPQYAGLDVKRIVGRRGDLFP